MNEEYRANMVYLKTRLKRSTDIEWDDHMTEQYRRTLFQDLFLAAPGHSSIAKPTYRVLVLGFNSLSMFLGK